MSESLLPDCPYSCNNGLVFLESQGWVDCPHCKSPVRMAERAAGDEFRSLYDLLYIPAGYRDMSEKSAYGWLDGFNSAENQKLYGSSVKSIVTTFTEILNRLEKGEIYRDSIYFCFTVIDTDRLVYATQVLAALNGVGTVPYISLNRLSQLLYSDDMLMEYKTYTESDEETMRITGLNTTLASRIHRLMGGLDYTDYVTAPLCMLELTTGTTDAGFLSLRDLLAERARLSLPTYVFGFCGMHRLAANGEYTTLGQFEGTGLRKLTQYTLTRVNSGSEKQGRLRGKSTSDKMNLAYRELGTAKDFGIYV